MENLPPPYPSRRNSWILPFKNKILMLRSKGYPFYQIAEILQPEAQKQGRKVSASIVSYWVTTWRQQEKKAEAKNPTLPHSSENTAITHFSPTGWLGSAKICTDMAILMKTERTLFRLMTCWMPTKSIPKLRKMAGIIRKYPLF